MPRRDLALTGRLTEGLVSLSRLGVGLAFGVVIFAVLVQVIGRSVFAFSPVWTEELTRFGLLFLIAFGAGASLRTGDLVNVDVVCEALPGRAPWRLRLVSAALTGLLCLALIGPAWRYTSIGAMQTSPALGWRMDFIHATVLIVLAGLALFAALRVLGMLTGATDGRPTAAPESRN